MSLAEKNESGMLHVAWRRCRSQAEKNETGMLDDVTAAEAGYAVSRRTGDSRTSMTFEAYLALLCYAMMS